MHCVLVVLVCPYRHFTQPARRRLREKRREFILNNIKSSINSYSQVQRPSGVGFPEDTKSMAPRKNNYLPTTCEIHSICFLFAILTYTVKKYDVTKCPLSCWKLSDDINRPFKLLLIVGPSVAFKVCFLKAHVKWTFIKLFLVDSTNSVASTAILEIGGMDCSKGANTL